MNRHLVKWVLMFVCVLCMGSSPVMAERIKDIATISGVRDNQLVGYGLVVGLDGTGDKIGQTAFTEQAFKNMLEKFGVVLPAGSSFNSKNIAAVMIHGTLHPFARPGQTIDVTVSSVGNASGLRGGTLLLTPLKGLDGQVYAIAQGNLVASGVGASGADGSSVTVNVPSVGKIPNGATVERAAPNTFATSENLVFMLRRPDFTTANRLVKAVNNLLGAGVARALDAGTIEVDAPTDPDRRVNFLSVVENLVVKQAEGSAKVIFNSRTGTIVIGQFVRVDPAAVTHGNLTVTIAENQDVSQADPFAGGETLVTNTSDVEIGEENNSMFVFKAGVSLDEIVEAVNRVGASPNDLMAILQALKEVGALKAELVVI